jgi:hypothetical protein
MLSKGKARIGLINAQHGHFTIGQGGIVQEDGVAGFGGEAEPKFRKPAMLSKETTYAINTLQSLDARADQKFGATVTIMKNYANEYLANGGQVLDPGFT